MPPEIRVGVNYSPPFSVIDTDGVPHGFSIDVIREAARRRGIRIRWIAANEGPDVALANGKVDVWPLVTDIPSRHGHILFTAPYLRSKFTLVVLKSSNIHQAENNAQLRISHADAPIVITVAEKFFSRAIRIPILQGRELVPVCAGNAEAALVDTKVAMAALLNRPQECAGAAFDLLPVDGASYSMAIGAIRSGWPAAKELRRELDHLASDGTLDEMSKKWLFDYTDETRIISDLAQSKQISLLLRWGVALLVLTIGVMIWHGYRQRLARKAIETAYAFVSGVLDTAGGLVLICDRQGRIVRFNRACEQVTGKDSASVRGQTAWELFVPAREQLEARTAFHQLVSSGGQSSQEHHWCTPAGERLFSWSHSVLQNANGQPEYIISTGIDITRHAVEERRLGYEAGHDALTGLPNRRRFLERMEDKLAEAAPGALVTVCFADLDYFKTINDSHGHATGDEVLVFFGRLLAEKAGPGSLAGRLGGDEFCLVMGGPDARSIVEEIRTHIERAEFQSAEGRRFHVTATFGLAESTPSLHDGTGLLHAADCALYEAKRAGRNRLAVFESAMPPAPIDSSRELLLTR